MHLILHETCKKTANLAQIRNKTPFQFAYTAAMLETNSVIQNAVNTLPDVHADTRAHNLGVAPVVYGEGARPPRGNYAQARSDYTCDQGWSNYTAAEHALYRRLYERQAAQLQGLACQEFIDALPLLGAPDRIPRFEDLSEKLQRATRWELVAVPGLIPEEAFFSLLAQRRFPVTHWLRTPEEFDYVVEPDIFHDLFGHVPLLFNPVFADYMQAYGQGGLKASRLKNCDTLSRLYWYTVEFGLIHTEAGMRAYGAGMLSSAGELRHSVLNAATPRLRFDLERIMRTRYRIDEYQDQYFVIEKFDDLFRATAPDFTPLYERMESMSEITSGDVQMDERAPWPLGEFEMRSVLAELPHWTISGDATNAKPCQIERELKFKDFKAAMTFMNAMAAVAEDLNHHPDWRNVYNRVNIGLTTHDAGNRISMRDIQFAQAVESYLKRN
jgi:phenylalanine-4-hydroxylase